MPPDTGPPRGFTIPSRLSTAEDNFASDRDEAHRLEFSENRAPQCDASGDVLPGETTSGVGGTLAAHIAILFHDFSGGGSERTMVRLANAWADRGRTVTIVCGDRRGPARDLVGAGVRVIQVAPACPRGLGSRLRLGSAVARLLPTIQANILILPGNYHLPILTTLVPNNIPVVAKLSNPLIPLRAGVSHVIAKPVAALIARRANLLVAIGLEQLREAADIVRGVPMALVPQPVLDRNRRPVERLPRPAGELRVLIAGRLERQKNVALALRAVALLPAAKLVIAGEGRDEASLRRLTDRLKLGGRIRFVGHLPSIAPLLAETDVLLSTSRYEGVPSVLIEAIAARVPVVTTPSSSMLASILLHASFGKLAEPCPHALAEALTAVQTLAPIVEDEIDDLHRCFSIDASADTWLSLIDLTFERGYRDHESP